MENKINFGIDLGTTNSVIAKFVKGNVEVFKNPNGFKETLPSVVGFKKERILVGDAARTFAEKDIKNFGERFKRKMGTSETFRINSLNQNKTPVELSAYVLKELKTFVHTGETISEAVITIPASFDIVQSNATKEAGLLAGFKQVELLQEPIAASLAYANKIKEKELTNGQWIVYDFGGGTFDAALIKIKDGDMTVVDHEGDNFLGGTDLDALIVEKIIIPHLSKTIDDEISFTNDLTSASGRFNQSYYKLLHLAEDAKIYLSSKTSAEIEFEFEDEEILITITRSEFEGLIKDLVDKTVQMIKTILTRKSFVPGDIQFILMVGGSTYIPFVKKRIEELLEIPVNLDIDPTTAIAIGAAYYAGTKDKSNSQKTAAKQTAISIKTSYKAATKDDEELFAAKVTGNIDGLFYKITRDDGGFDTGLKSLRERISEDLPLVENNYNYFKFQVFDVFNNIVETNAAPIAIAQGKFSIDGQSLSHDICLEVDDFDKESTKLELVFSKNSTLPLKKRLTKTVSKSITDEAGEWLVINILEGANYALPSSNKPVGQLIIEREQLNRDVIKGADVDLIIEMSESQELKISAYIPMTDQTFTQIYKQDLRKVVPKQLSSEVSMLNFQIKEEIKTARQNDDSETLKALITLEKEAEKLFDESAKLVNDDVSDAKFQIEDSKRQIAQRVDEATKDKRLSKAKMDYATQKDECFAIVKKDGSGEEKEAFAEIINQEPIFINSPNHLRIEERAKSLSRLKYRVLWRTPDFLVETFGWLESVSHTIDESGIAAALIFSGNQAREDENWERLREINHKLIDLLPETEQEKHVGIVGIF